MASAAIQDIQKIQQDQLKTQYDNRLSNQFVDELKSSTLFQCNWSELVGAAPTALSLMGSLWIAAADPKADKISMLKSMPTNGFKHIPNRPEPTLRSCLVDVCNNGGRAAFTKAGTNMGALQDTSKRIIDERIYTVFERLGPCTRDADALEDFRDALTSFNKDAKKCALLATETREAFTKWGAMVGELHACTEAESGRTSIQKDATRIDEESAKIQEKFAVAAKTDAEAQVLKADSSLKTAEKRLDRAIDNVPGPWATVVQGAVTGFTQALPHIVSGILPAVLAAANPVYAVGAGMGSSMKQGQQQPGFQGQNGNEGANGTDTKTNGNANNAVVPSVSGDPAYPAAVSIRDLVNHFYEYLGGESGKPNFAMFAEPESSEDAKKDIPQGLSYFLGTLTAANESLDSTNTEPNKKMFGVYHSLIEVTKEVQAFMKEQNDVSDVELTPEKLAAWKKAVKKSQQDVLQLTTAANAASSSSVPNPYANVKINVPKIDTSAQTAQVNSAMQGVQIAQNAVDAKQDAYDAAVARQSKTAAAMGEIQERLKRLAEQGKTLDEIKTVLRSCISVLVDLSVQIAKIEQFFTMLSSIIDHIILVRADDFSLEMDKAGRRALANGKLKIDDLSKATIYTSTLQLKGYFSVLRDISSMYTQVHIGYITQGMDLCSKLSKGAAGQDTTAAMQEELQTYMNDAGAAVAKLVSDKQQELVEGLRDRIRKAAETTQMLESAVEARGLTVDRDAKAAIQAGAEAAKEDAKKQIEAETSETVADSEAQNGNNF